MTIEQKIMFIGPLSITKMLKNSPCFQEVKNIAGINIGFHHWKSPNEASQDE
jgi:hypothetical protein